MKMKSEAQKRSKDHLKQMVKGRKRRARTAGRVMKYGTQSFARNAWLTVAAIAIMSVTLLVMSATLVVTSAMGTAIDMVRAQVDMSVYIKQDATEDEVNEIIGKLEELASVQGVKSVTPESANRQAIDKIINDENITDTDLIEAMHEAPNKLPWTLNVKIADLNDPSELEEFVYNDEIMEGMLDAKPPSFSSSHRETINNIANIMKGVEIGGLVAAGIFCVIAILVVFNTIRMAIFNRREEIDMMKLIGGSKWFIRGPFVVEAMLYGLIAGLIAGGVTYLAVSALDGSFDGALMPTVEFMYQWWWLVLAGLVVAGMLIGVISAMLATRRYLKLK